MSELKYFNSPVELLYIGVKLFVAGAGLIPSFIVFLIPKPLQGYL